MHIYLDENLSEHVANALNYLNKGYFSDVLVHSTKEEFGKGISDEELIPKIGSENGYLITRDFQIQKTRLQCDLLKKNGVGAFFIKLPKNMDKHWELVRLLINNWESIIEIVKSDKRPVSYRILTRGKVEKLS